MADLSDPAKTSIFDQFYKTNLTKNEQDAYLAGLVSVSAPARRRSRLETPKKSHSSVYHYRVCLIFFQFFLYSKHLKKRIIKIQRNHQTVHFHNFQIKIGNYEKVVCKTAFLSLHGITTSRLRRITDLVAEGVICPIDKRGGLNKSTCIPDYLKVQIQEHIQSLPYKISHYGKCGKKTRYLSIDLNVKIMWKLYLKKNEPDVYLSFGTENEKKPTISYEYYNQFYRDNFNYPFGRPRTDVCSHCEKLTVEINNEQIPAVKAKMKRQLEKHQSKAKQFYNDMKECELLVQEGGSEHGTSECVVFDYMQNIPYPLMPVSEMFYARKLWLYNIGFHRLSDGRAFMYPYTELTGKKTPNETLSFLNHFIEHHVDPNIKRLYIFTDACTAQNRNNFVAKYLHHLLATGRFNYIRHVFPTRGHSYLPCDRDFARVELKKRKQDTVYTPEQWKDVIRRSANYISVENVDESMIKDYKNLLSKWKLPVPAAVNKKEKWRITSYKVFEYSSKTTVRVSSCPTGLDMKTFQYRPQDSITASALKPAYESEIPLKPKKAEDIGKYVMSIHPQYRDYFQNLREKYGNNTRNTADRDESTDSEQWESE